MNQITLVHPKNYPDGIEFGYRPMTVLGLHRAIQSQLDEILVSEDDRLDITDQNASIRHTDELIEIKWPYFLTKESFTLLTNGSIIQYVNGVKEIWRYFDDGPVRLYRQKYKNGN